MHISNDLAPSAAERNVRSPMSDEWYAESLRLSFLGMTGWKSREIFSEIAGTPPAQINAQPPLQLYQETGNISEAYLSVTQQTGRIDTVLADQPTRNTYDPTAPDYKPLFSIGPLKDGIEMFDAISSKTTSLVSDATRVAYALTLIRQMASVREAMLFLSKYLPTVDFDPDVDLDLTFQINRQTRDNKGLLINRFARWDTIQVASLRMSIGGPPISPIPTAPPIFAARLYVDISTDINNTTPFTGTELSELVDEIRIYAIAIAEKGDSK